MGQHTLLILGSGYSGHFLAPLALQRYRHVFATSRDPERKLGHLPVSQRLQFDLTSPETHKNIPTSADMLWCFPAAPLEPVQTFAKTLGAPPRRIVVLGSTSAYNIPSRSHEYPPPWIDESAPIDLRSAAGAGRGISPKRTWRDCAPRRRDLWPGAESSRLIRSGRVGPSRKYVNLIHVEDLATICMLALDKGTPGKIYNVTDGTPRTWEDICRVVQARWGVTAHMARKDDRPGKRIKTIALREQLGAVLRHPDLYGELEKLEEAQR
jgi:hypothetical protein